MSGNLTLRRRGIENFEGWRLGLIFVAVGTTIVYLYFSMFSLNELKGFYSTLTEEGWLHYWLLLGPQVVALLTAPYFLRLAFRGRIEISDTGIAHISELPELLQGLRPDWRFTWSQVASANLQESKRGAPLLTPLLFKANGETIKMIPWQWTDRQVDAKQSRNASPLWKNKDQLRQLVADTPLVRVFTEQDKLGRDDSSIREADNNIDGSASAQFLAAGFIVLVGYFIFDSYFGTSEYYAGPIPWHFHVAAALCGFGLAAFILHYSKQLSGQGQIMAALFGLGIGLASHPFLLRANAWSDQVGLQSYSYTLMGDDTWVADTDVPALVFDIGSGYWGQFESGHVKTFELRQGGLGFYQVNMRPIYAEQRAFYKSR